ncbi:ECF RNA polymerase sigma factor SigK [Rhabdobacter roseus]|uniref:RNA polymerase sigma-70 factor (ECF subfamily) n=1 Tax=Rhabdobacter roseus TaxID=1655419 RepID=A0A840TVL7_9BACT|nr:sigma-70 family RNA polymerase sigma factor [Rhabdobacter roseus]MBB5285667.1 RNA polymerase sigma-70 factor (ECF subfamily) [Rhabdobacter roseus]
MAISPTKYSEEELIPLLKRSDKQAYQYLYDHYAGAIYSVLCKVLKDTTKAEDALQDAFLKIWKNMDAYDPQKGRLFTWMLNVARNSAIDMLRSESRKQWEALSPGCTYNEAMITYQPPISGLDLRRYVDELRPERKILVEMVYFQGYTHEEASEILKVPLGTVKSRIRTALLELRAFFAPAELAFS